MLCRCGHRMYWEDAEWVCYCGRRRDPLPAFFRVAKQLLAAIKQQAIKDSHCSERDSGCSFFVSEGSCEDCKASAETYLASVSHGLAHSLPPAGRVEPDRE